MRQYFYLETDGKTRREFTPITPAPGPFGEHVSFDAAYDAMRGSANAVIDFRHPGGGLTRAYVSNIVWTEDGQTPEPRVVEPVNDFGFAPAPMVEVTADEWLDGDSPARAWVESNARFAHREACEFIVHLFPDDPACFEDVVQSALAADCGDEFVAMLRAARETGAHRILLYV